MAMEPDLAHSSVFFCPEHFDVELVLLMGHVKCHVTFSRKKPLFEKLVVVPAKMRYRCRTIIFFFSRLE